MNGRAPEFKRVIPVTLINPETREFKTFHKNAHQQYLITVGKFYGCTYEVGKTEQTEKDPGNAEYKKLRSNGWIKWQDYCKAKNLYIEEYGYYLD